MAIREARPSAKSIAPQASRNGPITRERVLEVAAELFMERGYERATLAQIAHRLGISAPSLYWHFTSKEEVLHEFLKAEWLSFLEEIEQVTVAGSPTERLHNLVVTHVRHGLERRTASRAFTYQYGRVQLVHILSPERRQELHDLNERFVVLFRRIIQEGIDAGDFVVANLVVTSFAIMNACEFVISWFEPSGNLTIEEVSDLHGEYALRIVGADLCTRPGIRRFLEKPSDGNRQREFGQRASASRIPSKED